MDILEKINERKEPVTITLDTKLAEKLRGWRKKKKLKSLSPLINALLWEWIEEQEKEEGLPKIE